MQIHIHSKSLSIRDNLKEYAEEKIGKLTKVYPEILSADVGFTRRSKNSGEDKYKVEITLHCKGNLIRAEEDSTSPFAAVDFVAEKLERQLRRFKGKLYSNLNKHKKKEGQHDTSGAFLPLEPHAAPVYGNGATELTEPEVVESIAELQASAAEGLPVIVRSKSFAVKPMSPSEAALQMELLGHDFHVFMDDESSQVSVVYRRRDGNYGLIQPELPVG